MQFSRTFRLSRNSKIEKFQAKILKNVGCETFLVTAIGLKLQTEIWLILCTCWGLMDIKY